jgi:hypothetical protein
MPSIHRLFFLLPTLYDNIMIKNKRRVQSWASRIIAGLLISGAFFIGSGALTANAALPWNFSEPIVPCGIEQNPSCEVCDIFHLIKNLFEFTITMGGAIAVLMIIIIGTIYILGPSVSANALAQAKTAISYTILGFFLIVTGWAIINTVAIGLGYSSNWSTFDCTEFQKLIDDLQPPPTAPPISATDKSLCTPDKFAELAAQNGVIYPAAENKELTDILNCMQPKLTTQNINITPKTIEPPNSPYESCNYTRGNNTCNSCPYGYQSCHYGGVSGQGALAATFATSHTDTQQKIKDAANECDPAATADITKSAVEITAPSCKTGQADADMCRKCIEGNDCKELGDTFGGQMLPDMKNSPELDDLISCIKNSTITFIENGQQRTAKVSEVTKNSYRTFDTRTGDGNEKYSCNYSRGINQANGGCAKGCVHGNGTTNSCHYGGTIGQGSMAVDFSLASGYTYAQVGNQIVNAGKQCPTVKSGPVPGIRCEDGRGRIYPDCGECKYRSKGVLIDNPGCNINHFHANSMSCDRN